MFRTAGFLDMIVLHLYLNKDITFKSVSEQNKVTSIFKMFRFW